jgi:hypothetical protein
MGENASPTDTNEAEMDEMRGVLLDVAAARGVSWYKPDC